MKYPTTNWVSGFPDGELDLGKATGTKTLNVGLDTEYTQNSDSTNLCLSYQFSVFDCRTGIHKTGIYYSDANVEVRLTLKEVFIQVFKIAGIPPEEITNYHLNLICHFCRAEMAMVRDREEIARYFDYLYKTMITFHPVTLKFSYPPNHTCTITFELSDTILLLPMTHRSLEKATSLLDEKYHKKELSQEEKERMDLLLLNDKERFEEYAIHDADITLRLYIKLQHTLNILNGSDDVRYTTIGSATVKQFVKSMDKSLFNSQFSKKNDIYQKGLNLAKRAYMGGLSSSYYVGVRKGELFLDIDFSSAYPTCMNLLEVSDFGKPIIKPKDDGFSLGEVS